jgi:hypothetical protein
MPRTGVWPRGLQSAAEACATHLGSHIKGKE